MNITRQELKTRAKKVLSARYWEFLFIGFLQYVLIGIVSFNTGGGNLMNIQTVYALITVLGGRFVLRAVVNIFLYNPFRVCYCRFLIYNSDSLTVNYSVLWDMLKENYIKIVKNAFMRDLFLFLWSLPAFAGCVVLSFVLVLGINAYGIQGDIAVFSSYFIYYLAGMAITIGGAFLLVYKQYSYRMVDYILAEEPDLPWEEVINRSKDMMNGYKFFTFVLELSFIGWYLLGALACGIGTLFVSPYEEATMVQLYFHLKGEQRPYDVEYRVFN